MVQDPTTRHLSVAAVASQYGVTAGTVRKWLGRFLSEGDKGLMDRSSRPVTKASMGRTGLLKLLLKPKRSAPIILTYHGVSA